MTTTRATATNGTEPLTSDESNTFVCRDGVRHCRAGWRIHKIDYEARKGTAA